MSLWSIFSVYKPYYLSLMQCPLNFHNQNKCALNAHHISLVMSCKISKCYSEPWSLGPIFSIPIYLLLNVVYASDNSFWVGFAFVWFGQMQPMKFEGVTDVNLLGYVIFMYRMQSLYRVPSQWLMPVTSYVAWIQIYILHICISHILHTWYTCEVWYPCLFLVNGTVGYVLAYMCTSVGSI